MPDDAPVIQTTWSTNASRVMTASRGRAALLDRVHHQALAAILNRSAAGTEHRSIPPSESLPDGLGLFGGERQRWNGVFQVHGAWLPQGRSKMRLGAAAAKVAIALLAGSFLSA